MAKVLIYTTPARGHLYPIMDVALTLAKRGHDVHVRTLAAELDIVRAAGLRADAIADAVEKCEMNDWQAKSPLGSVKRAVQTFIDRASHEIEELKPILANRAHKPDLLVVDTNAWGAQALAEVSGIPWATWHPFPMPLPSKDAPPFGPGFAPARGPLGRLRDRLLQPVVIGPLQKFLPQLNAVRRSVGAKELQHITDLFRTPPVLLHMTAEPFEYSRSDWPANIKHIGPGLWSPPSSSSLRFTKPVVLVTCSTEFQDDAVLVNTAIEALGGDDSIQLVCTTAGVDPSTIRRPAASSVIVERFVPHATVLPSAAVVVCHGGMGITQRALALGVPVCVVPFGRDQLEVARRVVVCGAGTTLAPGKLSAARLRAAVNDARARGDGAKRVAAGFAASGGAERGATLLEELLAKTSNGSRAAA